MYLTVKVSGNFLQVSIKGSYLSKLNMWVTHHRMDSKGVTEDEEQESRTKSSKGMDKQQPSETRPCLPSALLSASEALVCFTETAVASLCIW